MATTSITSLNNIQHRAQIGETKVTLFVVIACIVAANGGLTFGYDIAISAGVTAMDDFLVKFFPEVELYKGKAITKDQNYCKYNNQALTAFTSSMYITALVATFGASFATRKYGRRPSILVGASCFLLGAIVGAGAVNLAMLILGRILVGVGVGFGNQAVPLYLSEIAPARIRGALNIIFQLAITIGILAASTVNYLTNNSHLHPWGWRLSLGLAGIPAVLMFSGGFSLPDTPTSLIERGHPNEGRALLVMIRGTNNVDLEYEDLVQATEKAKAVKHPFRNILLRKNLPQLIMGVLIPSFQQLTGINAIMFYAPVLFRMSGFKGDAYLYSVVVTGAVNVAATIVSIFTVDRWGRRVLFLEAGVQMFLSHVVIGIVLGEKFGDGTEFLSKGFAILLVVVICIYVTAFAWSWGPLGWLVPSEIFPLETRSAGQSITVSVNMLFTFIIAQTFLAMLCSFQYGIFLFFACWVVIMTLFVYFFLPETKNVPIDEMVNVWKNHRFWKRIVTVTADSTTENQTSSIIGVV